VQAAESVADRLRLLAVSESAYAAWTENIQVARREAPKIHEIQIAGLRLVNPAMVEQHIQVKPGDPVNPSVINPDLLRVYGRWLLSERRLRHARHAARPQHSACDALEKSWGPDYIRYGINLDSNFKSDSSYSLRLGYQKTWINSLGAELLAIGEIGSTNGVSVDYYQPVDARQRYFLETNLKYVSKISSVYQNDNKLAEYRILQGSARFGAGINLGALGQARAGWEENWWNPKLDTGLPVFPEQSKRYGGWVARFDLDQTDRLYFPTSGWNSSVKYFDAPTEHYSKVDGYASAYRSFGDWVLSSRVSYQGSPVGRLPFYDVGSLGGMLNMTAFAVGQLKGDDMSYVNARAERIIGRLPLGLRGDMRMGLAVEGAKIGTPYTETNLKGWINSTAIYLGGETPLGPVYLGYGYSSSGSTGGYSNLYLFLGTP
jgi:NTE family protein